MNILFCDQSIDKFGYSIFSVDDNSYKLLVYGEIHLNTKKNYADRILTLEQVFDELTEDYEIKQAVIEDIQYQSNIDTYKKLAALQFFLQYYFFYKKIDCYAPISVSSWRTQGLGIPHKNGKEILFNKLNILLGRPERLSNNMTDAIGIGLYYCKNILKLSNRDIKNAEMRDAIKPKNNIDGGIRINVTKRNNKKNKSSNKKTTRRRKKAN